MAGIVTSFSHSGVLLIVLISFMISDFCFFQSHARYPFAIGTSFPVTDLFIMLCHCLSND